jgi:hypothetical protein
VISQCTPNFEVAQTTDAQIHVDRNVVYRPLAKEDSGRTKFMFSLFSQIRIQG